ncbi:hypothetical protein K1T71_012824 [Dendrolimus kikuchii]|uniref:Uncharacterized protein n=1 Tax=Dendrolimus kikuchii TaxID=765133 RepID=A0ACC1CI74_9NEOP|nr:hypothetical protein K1T71_012824 [Dendrolimus kikuchii]
MKDNMKPCEHSLTEDAIYKEVVVIGNGPSGMVTSFMLAGNVPYLKEIPEDLPIDEMLRARLSNLPAGQSLYDVDLMELAEGLEGRSQNPIPLLMDNLLRPCADMGIQADSLIEWRYDVEKQIEHIVLGRGPPGGAWHTFAPRVRTLSPGAWLTLPPHAARGAQRLSARAVANYCRRYVHACRLQRYFRCGVVVNSVTRMPPALGSHCHYENCPLKADYCVSGYDEGEARPFRYACRRVVVACGAGDRANTLQPQVARHALHSLAAVERAVNTLAVHESRSPPSVVVIGSGVSAADGVWMCLRAGLHVRHLHRAPADALARLSPQAYPDYCQVYKMMCDGPSGNHKNYTPYPEHIIVDVQTLSTDLTDIEDYALTLKRVKLLNLVTNETTDLDVSLICVFIGSKPNLYFLQTNFNINYDMKMDCECVKPVFKRKIVEKQCFLRNHWHYLKSVLEQSIQTCKSKYLNLTEINGNTESKCVNIDCNRLDVISCDETKIDCECSDPYTNGIGYGLDANKPVDSKSNPVAIDKSTHEMLNAPKGLYALGPLTADNFVRFIPGGALALVSHMHKDRVI